jgi:hypothetical protein
LCSDDNFLDQIRAAQADLESLKAAKTNAYQNVENLSAEYSPEAFASLVNKIGMEAKQSRINSTRDMESRAAEERLFRFQNWINFVRLLGAMRRLRLKRASKCSAQKSGMQSTNLRQIHRPIRRQESERLTLQPQYKTLAILLCGGPRPRL